MPVTMFQHPAALLICDLQEKFREGIFAFDDVVLCANKLLRAAAILAMPVLATEQYPRALGSTVQDLKLPENCRPLAKTKFSMLTDEIRENLAKTGAKSCILVGIESHVCITQTARELLAMGYQVYLPVDGVSSARPIEIRIALDRLRSLGAQITSSDSLLFELVGDASHAHFKAISQLVKEHLTLPDSRLMTLYHGGNVVDKSRI